MKSLNTYIIEKFKINSKSVNADYNLDNIKPTNEPKLSDEEFDILTKFFNNNCKNVKNIKNNRGCFSIEFETTLYHRKNEKCRLVVSKPNTNNPLGYNIRLYKANTYMPTNYGSGKLKKGTKEPLINNIKEVIETLTTKFLNGKWAESVGAEIKK